MKAFRILPSIFIGSSLEGKKIAEAIQSKLHFDADCIVWDQDVFTLSSNTLDDLIDFAALVDFAIFVFSPDDILTMRTDTHQAIRDNVLFEFGLFTGILGKKCVFYLKPMDEDIHIPTDLIGITQGLYRANRSDGNNRAAVGPFCTDVKKIIDQWDSSNQEKPVESVTEFFPGKWKNEWYSNNEKIREEIFQIEDSNKFVIKGEYRFIVEDARINRQKNYLKFIRRGIMVDDNRRLSVTLHSLPGNVWKGFQNDGKKIVLTQI